MDLVSSVPWCPHNLLQIDKTFNFLAQEKLHGIVLFYLYWIATNFALQKLRYTNSMSMLGDSVQSVCGSNTAGLHWSMNGVS